MNRVRVQDLALVAVAGGLLAFELVSIGEALPVVKKAFADRGLSGKVNVASASAAAVPVPAVAQLAPQAVAATAKRHTHRLAASTAASPSKRCAAVTRARDARRAHGRLRFITVSSNGSCAVHEVRQTVVKRKEIAKAVDLALKQSPL